MLKGNDIIGMAVVAGDTGEEIGTVKDVIVHRNKKCVIGFLVQRAGWFQHARAVSFSEVASFDQSEVVVPTADSVVSVDQLPDAARLLERTPVVGSTLISSKGNEIGRVCDFYFDKRTGEFKGFEVVTEFNDDETSDAQFLPLNDDVFVGRDDVIVSEQVVDRLFEEATAEEHCDPIHELSSSTEIPKQVIGTFVESDTVVSPANPKSLKLTRNGTSLSIRFNTAGIPDDLCIAGYQKQIFQSLAEHEGCKKIIFDVTNFKYLPSSMLGLLATLRKKVDSLEILNPSPEAYKALKLMGFDKYMTVLNENSEEAAEKI